MSDSGDPTRKDPDGEDPEARRRRSTRQGLAYQGAFEAVVVIPIATGLGYWADTRFDTSPWLLIAGAALGFASFVLRLVRLGRQLQELEDEPTSEPSDSSERPG